MTRSKRAKPISIGKRVDEERERQGMTRKQLAEAVGVDASAVRSWASGRSSPRNLQLVAEVLGCTPAHLWRAE